MEKTLDPNNVVLLATEASLDLSQSISKKLKLPLSECRCGRFNDGEVRVDIGDNAPLRNSWVFIIGATPPPMEHWTEVWLLADAAFRAATPEHRIVWVAPYVGYGRQDRKINVHDAISSKLFFNMTKVAHVGQIIAVDLHCGQAQGFFEGPMANLWGRKIVLQRILQKLNIPYDGIDQQRLQSIALGGPDPGAYKICWHYASKFNCILVGGLKTRPAPGELEMVLVGGNKVQDRTVIILDDMSDTSGTVIEFAKLVKEKGAKQVIAGFTHPVLSSDGNGIDAVTKIESSAIDAVVTTDTLPLKRTSPKFEVVSVADELAEAIRRTVIGDSVSGMATKF